jgi:hypothetical protein
MRFQEPNLSGQIDQFLNPLGYGVKIWLPSQNNYSYQALFSRIAQALSRNNVINKN